MSSGGEHQLDGAQRFLLDALNAQMCGSNAFQGYFDDAKESRVKQIPKIQEWSFQESSFKNQDSRIIKIKIQESREESIKISIKKVFQNIE